MKIKWQIGIIVLFIAFLGTYLEDTIVPNQQIVIQFSDINISSEDAENTIEAVKEQLQNIGVSHINIGQHADGKLRITYYSDADVSRIQNILFKENHFRFSYQTDKNDPIDFPESKNVNDYEINISKIKDEVHANWGFEGIQIVELNHKSDRFNNPTDNLSGKYSDLEKYNAQVRVAIQVNSSITLTVDNILYIIPEVRAGPVKVEFII